MSLFKKVWPYLRHQTPILIFAYLCMLVLGAATAAYAFLAGPALKFIFSGSIVDIIHHADGSLRSMWNWLPPSLLSELEKFAEQSALYMVPILIVIVAFIKGMAQTGQFYLMGKASQRVLLHLRSDAFDSMLKQSPSFFAKRAHGDLLSRLTNDANLVEQAIFYGITPAVREPLSVIFLLVYCFVTNPRLALFTFVIVPLAVLPLVRFSKWLKRVSHRGQTAQGDINAVCYEALAGVRVVQAFGTEKIENQRLEKSASRYFKQMLTSYFIRAVRTPTMEFLGAIALGSLLGLLGYRVRVLGDDPAQYISFFVAVVMMYDPLKKLGQVADYIATGGAAIERIYEIIDSPTDINDCATAYELPPFNNAIVFAGVNFSYNENPVLEYIDLTINRGQVVALVGRSGSGKTTLANLLPRFYDIKGGSLTIDGHALNKVTLASLRKQISVVSQDTFLFNTSIAANIAYGRPDASFDDIKQAAMAAHAVEFIEKLSQGYETVIGERGVTLSGGQRQRLAIARAFLRNAPLLILDEATSSLDVESEHHVQAALDELMTERTCLVIAHRLSTVRRADHIAVLKDGHIIERGRHQQLIELGGEYARLYDMQFQDEKPLATPTNAS